MGAEEARAASRASCFAATCDEGSLGTCGEGVTRPRLGPWHAGPACVDSEQASLFRQARRSERPSRARSVSGPRNRSSARSAQGGRCRRRCGRASWSARAGRWGPRRCFVGAQCAPPRSARPASGPNSPGPVRWVQEAAQDTEPRQERARKRGPAQETDERPSLGKRGPARHGPCRRLPARTARRGPDPRSAAGSLSAARPCRPTRMDECREQLVQQRCCASWTARRST